MGLSDFDQVIQGFTDGTNIGNVSDSLKTYSAGTADNDTTASGQNLLVGGKDDTGVQRPVLVDDAGRLVTRSITGLDSDFSFGQVTTTALTQVAIRSTTYTEPTVNAQRSMSSSSANDTAAGTGARMVQITYYTSAGVGPLTETLTLNGTTAVNTVATNICFIEDIRIVTAGSTGSNVGILTLFGATAGGGGTVFTVAATIQQTLSAHHYVAAGKTCNITSISCGHNGTIAGSGGVFVLKALTIGVANAADIQVSDFVRLYGQSSTTTRTYNSPIKIVGPARLVLFVTPETSSSTIYRGSFDFFEP